MLSVALLEGPFFVHFRAGAGPISRSKKGWERPPGAGPPSRGLQTQPYTGPSGEGLRLRTDHGYFSKAFSDSETEIMRTPGLGATASFSLAS